MTIHPLRIYRTRTNTTLKQFGARFGVNKSTVLRWEEGHIPAERVIAISEITGIPRSQLRPDLYPQRERAA
jgi:transcriptional regulator with XRE-family HTH domain